MDAVPGVSPDDYSTSLGIDGVFTVSKDYFRFNPVIGTDIRES
jgi:hypothetical protein